ISSWGMAGVLFFHSESIAHQSLLLIILVMGASAITTTSTAYSPTFYPVVMMLLPMSLQLVITGDTVYQLLGASFWLFIGMLFFLHRNTHSTYATALRLRFQNESLAEELALQKDIAEQANIAKSQFLAEASHDLRQPLHALSLFFGKLQQNADEPLKRKPLLENIDTSINTLTDLFNGLLDVSRFEVGVVHTEPINFSMNNLLDNLRQEYTARAQTEGLVFCCVPCSALTYTDPLLLQRIVRNLVENAIRYTSTGRVLVGCRRLGDSLSVQVWDTGIGIPAEHIDAIFTEFQQLNNPGKDRSKGLGLGLSVVKQLARALDHELSVRSVPGKGTVFSLQIPRSYPVGAESDDPTTPYTIADKLGSACVLVIDDDSKVREGMRELISSWGSKTLTASSVVDALSAVDESPCMPDLIVSDFHLGSHMTGIDAISKLRKKCGNNIPAVLISADTSEKCLTVAEQNDVPLLHKPVTPGELATLLRFLLSEHVSDH
ncbi:MAG: ATP-binding protein, partial [Gammaproteobacteria bacterium]